MKLYMSQHIVLDRAMTGELLGYVDSARQYANDILRCIPEKHMLLKPTAQQRELEHQHSQKEILHMPGA